MKIIFTVCDHNSDVIRGLINDSGGLRGRMRLLQPLYKLSASPSRGKPRFTNEALTTEPQWYNCSISTEAIKSGTPPSSFFPVSNRLEEHNCFQDSN